MMVYGHTVSALLAPEYRGGAWYDAWVFQRGLTSSLFLLLAGFAFSVATTRRTRASRRRCGGGCAGSRCSWCSATPRTFRCRNSRRFPAPQRNARSFLAVDVLQLIGVTFVVIQAIVLAIRSRRAFIVVSLALAALTIAMTPAMWTIDWASRAAWRGDLSVAGARVAVPALPVGGVRAHRRRRRPVSRHFDCQITADDERLDSRETVCESSRSATSTGFFRTFRSAIF
jgi:hypothetical protein